jgi:cyclic pyranopterin phosphate synthase
MTQSIDMKTTTPSTDENPAHLATAIRTNETIMDHFNTMQGKLRVSVTHTCQLRCQFCHQEGIEQHWVPTHMSFGLFHDLIEAYSSLGGHYVELTGGEALCHPEIQRLIETASHRVNHLTLCTNGLLLHRILKQLEVGLVNEIKLSLHAASNSNVSKRLLGDAWDIEIIRDNVEQVLDKGTKLQIIYTHTGENSESLPAVLELALKWGANMQIVDLICSRDQCFDARLGYMGGATAEQIASRYARFKENIHDRTGAVLRLYETEKGSKWEIKDYHYGLFHSNMCSGCPQKIRCGEGIYALRVDALGIFKPCLLRKDLEVNVLENVG